MLSNLLDRTLATVPANLPANLDTESSHIRAIRDSGRAVSYDTIQEADTSALAFRLGMERLTTESGRPVNARAIIREDTREPLGVVGNRYAVIQPEDCLGIAREVVRETGGKLSGCRVLGGGRDISLTVTLPGESIEGKDLNIPTVRITANNEGTGCVTAGAYMFRTFCRNAYYLIVSGARSTAGVKALSRVSVRHTRSGVDRVQTARGIVAQVLGRVESFEDEFRRLIGIQVSPGALLDYYAEVMPKPDKPADDSRDAVLSWRRAQQRVEDAHRTMRGNFLRESAEGFPESAWLAVNSVTKFAQHQAKVRGASRDPEARVYANMPGGSAYDLSVRAIETAHRVFA